MSRYLGAAVLTSLLLHGAALGILSFFIDPDPAAVSTPAVRIGLISRTAIPAAPPENPEIPPAAPTDPVPETAAAPAAAEAPVETESPAAVEQAAVEPLLSHAAAPAAAVPPPSAVSAGGSSTEADSGPQLIPLSSVDISGARITAPSYPERARQMGWEGDVRIVFDINEKGRVVNASVLESSEHGILDECALNTVKKSWRFAKDQPYRAVVKTFSFRLN